MEAVRAKIRQLSSEAINQIAAGEVIERPASVVKELVENSIDAGSTKISVLIENFGKDLIEVIDNGIGMSKEDISECIKRHATSKISSFADIFVIKSLGFRGEAIPSIASISEFQICSRTADDIEGTMASILNEKIINTKPIGMAPGTKISVKNLFYNTPVRKKFLKADKTELSAISDMINKIAIAHPGIEFNLIHNDKEIFAYRKASELKNRLLDIFGKHFSRNSSEVVFEDEELFIRGFVGAPSINKGNASGLYIFVNGRFIRDKSINHAIINSYRTFLMNGRFPVVVVSIEIDPRLVDINIHPTKAEVKFVNPGKIYDLVSSLVSQKLSTSFWIEKDFFNTAQTSYHGVQGGSGNYENRLKAIGGSKSSDDIFSSNDVLTTSFTKEQRPREVVQFEQDLALSDEKAFFSTLRVIGQFRALYMVCEKGEKLYLLDHHAAHERIMFEKIVKDFYSKKIESQNLLVPIVLDVDATKTMILSGLKTSFLDIGIEFEHFGENTFVVKMVPALIPEHKISEFINDLIDNVIEQIDLAETGLMVKNAVTPFLNKIFSSLACHSALRGEKRLSQIELEDLLQQLDEFEIPPNCPHGRPIIVEFTLDEIEKKFGRVK